MNRRPVIFPLILVSSLALAAGCDKKDESSASVASSASSLAPSVAQGKTVKFVIDPKSKTSIDMPAPKEHIKADTSAASGSLEMNLTNLADSRGEVRIDLSTLNTHTFGNDQDATQTEHAHTWLELGAAVAAGQRESNRWAVFAIRSIDGLSAPDLSKVAAVKEGSEDVRIVTATAHGDFLLHGHKVPKDVTLVAKFHYPSGAAADARPSSLDVTSAAPLHVTLAEHDVKPRDTLGKLAQATTSLLGKVAETADVSFDLLATPQG